MNYVFSSNDSRFPSQLPVSGTNKFASIVLMTINPLLYFENEGPPSGRYFVLINGDSSSTVDTIQLTEKRDSMLFRCPPKQLARILSANVKPGTMLLIRDIDNLKVGPIKTWYINKNWRYRLENKSDFWRRHNLNRSRVANMEIAGLGKISLAGGLLPDCEDHLQWRIRFGDEPWRKFPPFIHGHDTPLPTARECLLWIGDLDGDNLPDLILNPSIEDYSGFFIQLFLSSQYKAGKTWKPAAMFYWMYPGTSESSGC